MPFTIATGDVVKVVYIIIIFNTESLQQLISYLVGVSINANNLDGVSKSACKMGRANAPVFPDPVSARPMISRPTSINQFDSRRLNSTMYMYLEMPLEEPPSVWEWVWPTSSPDTPHTAHPQHPIHNMYMYRDP